MKQTKIIMAAAFVVASITLQSCATVFGGKISDCQRTKPAHGQPARQIRPVALIADCLTGLVWVGVDFATGAIYKPCPGDKKGK